MIAQELEVSLHMAFVEARQKRHEFITVEHLLLALLDNPTAAEVLRACGANMDELRKQPGAAYRRADAAHRRRPRGRHPAHARLPARDPARDPARPILRQEGSDRRERAGRDLRREGLARGVLPAAAGNHAARRGQLHFARHHQDAAAAPGQERAGSRAGRRSARPANSPLDNYTQNLNALALAGKIDPLIGRDKELERVVQTLCRPAQEQPAARRRGGRRQDRDRRRPGAAHRRRQRARTCSRSARCSRSTWAPCSPAPSIAAISSSA